MTLVDRVVAMKAGRIEQVRSPMDACRRPANPFVARFIGSPAMTMPDARLPRARMAGAEED